MKNFNFTKMGKFNSITLSLLGNLFFVYCVIIALAIILFSSVSIECEVIGESMMPTFNSKGRDRSDVVYVNKYDNDYHYGDIVVIDTDSEPIIKRVIGLPGDRIDIIRDLDGIYRLERNGEIIEENYIFDNSSIYIPTNYHNGMDVVMQEFDDLKLAQPEVFENGKFVVAEDEIFVLGDNRANSKDSANEGGFKINNVQGKVELVRYYGESEFGFYWDYIMQGKFIYTFINIF